MATGTIQFPKNNLGTNVNLKTYSTFATRYKIPCDGYVYIAAGNGASYRGRIFSANATAETAPYMDLWATQKQSGNYFNANFTFVRKGMSVRSITGDDSSAYTVFSFFPLE